jgi:PAS domain S-box-containing protein
MDTRTEARHSDHECFMSPIDLRVFEDIAVPAIVLDRTGSVVAWNGTHAAMVGYSSDDVIGRNICEFLTAESGLRLLNEMENLSTGTAPAQLELDWRTKMGEVTTVALSAWADTSTAGEPALVVMTGAPRLVIRGARIQYEELVSLALDAIVAIDAEQQIVMFNRGAERIFGWSAAEALGQTIDILIPSPSRGRHRAAIAAFARSPESTRPMARRPIIGVRKNGEEFPAEVNIYKVDLAGTTLLAAVLRDIGARKRQESQLTFLAHASQTLASSLDYDETLGRVARLAVPLLADCCAVDLLEESGVRRLKVVHVDPNMAWLATALEAMQIREPVMHPILQALEERRPVLIREVPAGYLERVAQDAEHLRLLGELAPVSWMSVPLIARDRVLGALSFWSVRPERVYGQEDLQLAEELARRAAVAIDNSQLYALAQRAIRARDEVLGVVAHDLRNPLNVIELSSMVMLRKLEDDREKLHSLVQMIRQAAGRARRLIEDLLDMARIEGGLLAVERTRCQPDDLLDAALDMMRPGAEQACIELTGGAQPGMSEIEADRDRILQVFSNLVGNAIKFTPAGGRVGMTVTRSGKDVCFSVSDTGPGIPADHLPHLFDRFWQAEPRDRRGAGLGLAIAKTIVEAHGGRLWAESTPGQGSTFFFTVPMMSSAAQQLEET